MVDRISAPRWRTEGGVQAVATVCSIIGTDCGRGRCQSRSVEHGILQEG